MATLALLGTAACNRDPVPVTGTPVDAAAPDLRERDECPDKPDNPCPRDGLECTFSFTVGCACLFPERTWVCCGGPVQFCPDTRPTEGALCACPTSALGSNRCGYCGVECDCLHHRWSCFVPDAGAACDGG